MLDGVLNYFLEGGDYYGSLRRVLVDEKDRVHAHWATLRRDCGLVLKVLKTVGPFLGTLINSY